MQEKILSTNLGCSTSNPLQRKYWTKDWWNDLTLSLGISGWSFNFGGSASPSTWPLRKTVSPWAASASPFLGIMLPLCFGSSVGWEIDFPASQTHTVASGNWTLNSHSKFLPCTLRKPFLLDSHCPSAIRSCQLIFLLRTSHLRKSIFLISLCVFQMTLKSLLVSSCWATNDLD